MNMAKAKETIAMQHVPTMKIVQNPTHSSFKIVHKDTVSMIEFFLVGTFCAVGAFSDDGYISSSNH